MLSYLHRSDVLKVNTRELEHHVLGPNEPRVDIEHIVRQARGEQQQRLFQIFSRQEAKYILVASVARCEEHLRMLTVLERRWLDLSEAVEQLSGKQELLATLMESKKSLQKTFWKISREDLPGVEGAGGAEVKRGFGAVGTQAQVGKIDEGKGSSQDVPPFVLARPRWHMTWTGARTWKEKWRSWR